MANLDMKKTLKHLYKPSAKEVSVVDVPPMNYLMVDGTGNPNTSKRYQQAIKALYKVAYTIRGISKEAGIVFTVMPLEGLWDFEGQQAGKIIISDADKDKFVWTAMILQPEHVSAEMVEQALEIASKNKAPALLDDVRFETYHEGDAVQIMHIGSYQDETPNIMLLHDYIEQNGWSLSKKHHEIYLNDARKVAPEKLKTVIRQPFGHE